MWLDVFFLTGLGFLTAGVFSRRAHVRRRLLLTGLLLLVIAGTVTVTVMGPDVYRFFF